MDQYRYVGLHANELQGGTPIGPGEVTGPIDVSPDDSPQNAMLLAEGLLLVLPSEAEAKKAEAAAKAEAKTEEIKQ